MRDWLLANGVTIAAMESTSTYWKPPFYCLDEVTDVWLLNAAHIKAVRAVRPMWASSLRLASQSAPTGRPERGTWAIGGMASGLAHRGRLRGPRFLEPVAALW